MQCHLGCSGIIANKHGPRAAQRLHVQLQLLQLGFELLLATLFWVGVAHKRQAEVGGVHGLPLLAKAPQQLHALSLRQLTKARCSHGGSGLAGARIRSHRCKSTLAC